MSAEKKAIRVWDYTRQDFDELVDKVNRAIDEGWRLTHMEKVTSGQEVEISFERETSAPPAKPTLPTRESIWKMLNAHVHSAAMVEVILESLKGMGVTFPVSPSPKASVEQSPPDETVQSVLQKVRDDMELDEVVSPTPAEDRQPQRDWPI